MISICEGVSRVSYSPSLENTGETQYIAKYSENLPVRPHLPVGKTSPTSATNKVVERNSKSSYFIDRGDPETNRAGKVENSGEPLNQSDTFTNFHLVFPASPSQQGS